MSSPSPGGLRRIDSFKVHTPREVLEFWFPTATFEDLSSDLYIQRMMDSIWPGLGFTYEFKVRKNSETENEQPIEGLDSEEPGFYLYDECENFLPAMQAAARMKLGWTEENDQAVLARVLLLDQMFSILTAEGGRSSLSSQKLSSKTAGTWREQSRADLSTTLTRRTSCRSLISCSSSRR